MATFSFGEFMREGGWGMWPVLLLGLVALASSIRYAAPARTAVPPLRGAAVADACWSSVVHASVTDVAAVFRYFEDPARAPDGQIARLLFGASRNRRAPPRWAGSS